MRTPESASEITVEWLRNALPWQGPGCRPVSAKVEPNFGGPSLLGRLARVKLSYATPGCGPASLLIKFQARPSDWEAQIYRLLSETKTLAAQRLAAQRPAVPRLFGAFDNGTLALEDMSPARAGSQVEGCTLQQAWDVLAILADIHGRFWDDARVPAIPAARFAAVIDFNMAQCWELFEDRYRDMLGDTTAEFAWLWRNAATVSAHRLSEPTTLFHGDVHAENLLFRDDEARRPVLIDWQLAGRGLAANDVSFFLVKSLTVAQRRAAEAQLLDAYYGWLPERVRDSYGFHRFTLDYRACVTRSMLSAAMLVGPRFADRADQFELADVVAARVIAAVRDHNPVAAIRELGELEIAVES